MPKPPPEAAAAAEPETPKGAGGYRPWAELLARTFAVDMLACPRCKGRMKPLALVTDPASIAHYLAAVGEATEVPRRSPNRGPPYWKSRVLRRLGHEEDGSHSGRGGRGAVGVGPERGAPAAWSGLRVARDRRHGALPRDAAPDVPGRYRGGETPVEERPPTPARTGENGG